MKRVFWIKYRLLIIGMAIALFSSMLEYLELRYIPQLKVSRGLKSIEREIAAKEKIIFRTFDSINGKSIGELYSRFDELLKLSKEKRLLFFVYEDAELKFWTSNKVEPEIISYLHTEPVFQKLINGYYLQYTRRNMAMNQIYVCLIPIQNNYSITNHYLRNRFYLGKARDIFYVLPQLDITPNSLSVKSSKGEPLFFVGANPQAPKDNWLVLGYLLGGALVFIFILRTLNAFFRFGRKKKAYLVFFAFLATTILGWKILKYPAILFELSIFNPQVYASSALFSSLGDLLILTLIIFWAINTFTHYFEFRLPSSKYLHVIYGFLSLLFTVAFAAWISWIIRRLIMDSNISLDMGRLFSLNANSLLSYLILFMLFYSFNQLSFYLFKKIDKSILKTKQWVIIILLPALVYGLSRLCTCEVDYLYFAYPLFTWLLYLVYSDMNKLALSSSLAFMLISAGFAAHEITYANMMREQETRKLLVTWVASDRDNIGEEILATIYDQLGNDNYVRNYFSNPLLSKSLLDKRIKQVYLSGYLSKYDFNIHAYNLDCTPYKSSTEVPLDVFIQATQTAQIIEPGKNIFFFNSFDGAPAYLMIIPAFRLDLPVGYLVVELKEKPFLEESAYPELLIDRNVKRTEELKNYSYAIYRDNALVNQKGNYFYPLVYDFPQTKPGDYVFYKEKRNSHLLFRINEKTNVVMTYTNLNLFSSLALFSILFIFSVVLLSVATFLSRAFAGVSPGQLMRWSFYKNVFSSITFSFQSKIQLTILASILVALILTGFFSTRFITQRARQNANNELYSELKAVTENIRDYVHTAVVANESISIDELFERLDQLAHLFRSDINLFDYRGNLITSTQLPIFERGIISRRMDEVALMEMTTRHKSHLIQEEHIGGRFSYLSAYSYLHDPSTNAVFIINIPYFAKENSVKKEVSSLLVTTINLYVFLFLIILLFSFTISSTFTEPLEIIRRHLADLQLGKTNKKISWHSNDEIGTLINEYNRMLVKVEESAYALARSERESAWREMAKQVAHEIKNPLTPMKLNVQQLMRAWQEKAPNLDESIRKTTKSLIQSIESLSQIASEFSEFARMPEPQHQNVVLEELVSNVYYLFAETEGVKLKLHLRTERTTIFADPKQLERVFNNLVKNSIQAIPPDRQGIIEISSMIEKGEIIICISDNGSGIPPEIRDKIFLPNFSTKTSGMGLGLAIASRIVRSSEGRIWFDTIEGYGTKFYVALPVVKEGDDQI